MNHGWFKYQPGITCHRDLFLLAFLSAVVRVDGGPQSDTPPPEVWGKGERREGVRAEDREKESGDLEMVDQKERESGGRGGGVLGEAHMGM